MKRYINIILTAVLGLFASTSCNDVVLSEVEHRTGYLSVSLDRDDEVFAKALVAPEPDMAFEIKIYKGNTLVQTVRDHRTLTTSSPLELPIGTYKVVATYGDDKGGFDAPFYKGETEVKIRTGVTEVAEIICTLANVMVTVEFDRSIKENFPTHSVLVTDGSGSATVLSFSNTMNTLSKVGYIPATGTLKWDLNLINADGIPYVNSGTYTNVKPRQHYNLKFVLSEDVSEGGYAAIKLIVDSDLIREEFDIELDFSESELPSFSSNDGFELTNSMSVIVGDDSSKELTFSSPEGVRSFIIALETETLTRSAAARQWFELVEASQETINYLASVGVRTQSVPYGATSVTVDFTDYVKELSIGDFNLEMTLYDIKGHVSSCPMEFKVMSDFNADVTSATPWAKFAVIRGEYFSEEPPQSGIFMYKKSSETEWKRFSCSLVCNTSSKTFTGELGGLEPETTYMVKAVSSSGTEPNVVSFKTDRAQNLYNMSFDDWSQSGKVWYPYKEGASPAVWDSANEATASFGGSSTTKETSHVVRGAAARMESKYVVIAFAAGNLYTGKFGAIQGLGASLDWGASFSSRPVALRGYYDYKSSSINRTKSPYDGMKGKPDKCQLMVLLTDWDKQFNINTTEGKFVDLANDPSIIASVKYESEVTTGGYKEFVLPIEYRDLTRTPKYVVVVACSSYMGDYFTGGEGSTLYVDEFSFEYDVTTLTEEQKAKVNYR